VARFFTGGCPARVVRVPSWPPAIWVFRHLVVTTESIVLVIDPRRRSRIGPGWIALERTVERSEGTRASGLGWRPVSERGSEFRAVPISRSVAVCPQRHGA
jgi:hypothetical protein